VKSQEIVAKLFEKEQDITPEIGFFLKNASSSKLNSKM
jgi:hypothetical protein